MHIVFEADLVEPCLLGIWRDGEELEAWSMAFCGDLCNSNLVLKDHLFKFERKTYGACFHEAFSIGIGEDYHHVPVSAAEISPF